MPNIVIINLLPEIDIYDSSSTAAEEGLKIKYAAANLQIIEAHELALAFKKLSDTVGNTESFAMLPGVKEAQEKLKNANKIFILVHGIKQEEGRDKCFYKFFKPDGTGELCMGDAELFNVNELVDFISTLLKGGALIERRIILQMCYAARVTPRDKNPIAHYRNPQKEEALKSSFVYMFFADFIQKNPHYSNITVSASTMTLRTDRKTGRTLVDSYELELEEDAIWKEMEALSQQIDKCSDAKSPKAMQLDKRRMELAHRPMENTSKEHYGRVLFYMDDSGKIHADLKHPENHPPRSNCIIL